MFRIAFLIALILCTALPARSEKLTIDRLVGSPSLDGPRVNGLKIAPDGSRVTFLKGKESDFRVQDLWEYDIASGETRLLVDSAVLLGGTEETLSEVEKARRERQRISASGIVEYSFSDDGRALLFPLNGDLYYLPLGGAPKRLTKTETFETDARFSPRGRYVSFIREQNLYIIDVESGVERAITKDGAGTISYGMAEFVAQEEMDRDTGYWWAPDESRIAFTRIDESPVALVNRYELAADGGVTAIAQRYPFAGTPNVDVALMVVRLEDGAVSDIDLRELDFHESDIYLSRVDWLPDGRRLVFQREPRDQKRLDLILVDTETGAQELLLSETSESWINLSHDLEFLKDGDRFLWSSERDGFRHLYLYRTDGTLIGRLTAGKWVVSSLVHVDEAAGIVYFTGFADGPLEHHLYAVPLVPDPDAIRRLTKEDGWHGIAFGDDGSVFIDTHSAPDVPPHVALRRADGTLIASIEENRLDDSHPYAPYLDGHARPEFGTIAAADGSLLYYSLLRPADFDPGKRYPAIVNVYGGPGAQRVAKRWQIDFDQILAREGYIVMRLDNRGSTNRGHAFESVLYRAMGVTEVEDQVAGARFLGGLPYVDPARIGVYGWSYGGYMTLQLLAKAPEVYRAGISVAPVSDWRLYDTHYTERYLGQPGEGDVYETSSVFPYLAGMRPHALFLVHGMADDNVFFDHSVKLMTALQTARIPFRLMTYPGKRHGIAGADARAHLWTQALDFFDDRLK
ncbi:MAG: S9 family peptidase [Rhodothalassiaceae bacterium]